MMNALVSANLFSGYKVGQSDDICISHLQFADDSLLLGHKCWANIRSLKALILLFEISKSIFIKACLLELMYRSSGCTRLLWF
jgi:hypothetical protein